MLHYDTIFDDKGFNRIISAVGWSIAVVLFQNDSSYEAGHEKILIRIHKTYLVSGVTDHIDPH